MTKIELIDLIRELAPPTHRMTVEKLASVVYSDAVKAIEQRNPLGLSLFRKTYNVEVTDSKATIPIPYISLNGASVLVPSEDLLYAPVTEEEMNLLNVIDDIDTVVKYFIRGNEIIFNGLETGSIVISVVPTLEGFLDTDQIELSTDQIATVLNFLRPMPEKQVNDRNNI